MKNFYKTGLNDGLNLKRSIKGVFFQWQDDVRKEERVNYEKIYRCIRELKNNTR